MRLPWSREPESLLCPKCGHDEFGSFGGGAGRYVNGRFVETRRKVFCSSCRAVFVVRADRTPLVLSPVEHRVAEEPLATPDDPERRREEQERINEARTVAAAVDALVAEGPGGLKKAREKYGATLSGADG